jgi:hypothetical protein
MTDQQHHVSFTPSSPDDIEPLTAGSPQENWDEEMEKEREARVRNLQLISELLIKNQRLIELLDSATNRQNQEFACDYDQNL